MRKTMIIIMGKENSGKFRLCRALEEQGLKRVVSYTTRPDSRGTHIVCEDEFRDMLQHGRFFQHTKTGPDGEWYYGTLLEDFEDCDCAIMDEKDFGRFMKLAEKENITVQPIYLVSQENGGSVTDVPDEVSSCRDTAMFLTDGWDRSKFSETAEALCVNLGFFHKDEADDAGDQDAVWF